MVPNMHMYNKFCILPYISVIITKKLQGHLACFQPGFWEIRFWQESTHRATDHELYDMFAQYDSDFPLPIYSIIAVQFYL